MRLRRIATGKWTVVAEVDDGGVCDVCDVLDDLSDGPKTKGIAAGFKAHFDRIPAEGPRQLPDGIYHCVDADEGIYEFIKGRYRVVCFQANGRIVVCSAVEMKKSQKTPKKWVARAVALRVRYEAADQKNELVFEE